MSMFTHQFMQRPMGFDLKEAPAAAAALVMVNRARGDLPIRRGDLLVAVNGVDVRNMHVGALHRFLGSCPASRLGFRGS